MPELHGVAAWAGVKTVVSCQYTTSHGLGAGKAVLVCAPDVQLPGELGDLAISDGNTTILIPGCRLESLRDTGPQPGGRQWILCIADRRWRWKDMGIIQGHYNQRDKHNLLIPWTVKTPQQLAVLCLEAMGETGYSVNLPTIGPGATVGTGQGASPDRAPVAGNFPEMKWDYINPAQALQQLCDQFNARIVYRLDTDSVLITPLGFGDDLPQGGAVLRSGPTLGLPARPDSILLIGAPIRRQQRFLLEAVGEDYDGSIRPINDLSYTPVIKATVQQVTTVTVGATVAVGNTFNVTITPSSGAVANDAQAFLYTATNTSASTVASALATAINNGAARLAIASAKASGAVITITGNTVGDPFDVLTIASTGVGGTAPSMTWSLVTTAKKKINGWGQSGPPLFPAAPVGQANPLTLVQATPNLTAQQASLLAQKSVFSMYRIINRDPYIPGGYTPGQPLPPPKPLILPGATSAVGLGVSPDLTVQRRQQLLIEDVQVDQVLPQSPDANILGKDGQPLLRDLYNATSRDKPAKCYGSYFAPSTGVNFVGSGSNSPVTGEVIVEFSVDADQGLVIFSEPVYYLNGSEFEPAVLTLQCAVQYLDPDTNEVERYRRLFVFADGVRGTAPAVIHRDDCVYYIANTYYPQTNKVKFVNDNSTEINQMADFYLQAEALKYEVTGAQEKEWGGILPLWLDGAISQVSWSIGGDGAKTHASRNSEHDYFVPNFNERRKIEYLNLLLQRAGRGTGPLAPGSGAGFGP